MTTNVLKTFLWFNTDLEKVLAFYENLFGAKASNVVRNETGGVFIAEIAIYGHELVLMNSEGGPVFNDSISLSLSVDGQSEVDRIWDALTANGEEGRCGWCKDEFGVSWQVTPIQMSEWLQNPDPEVRGYAWPQLMQMSKIILEDLHR